MKPIITPPYLSLFLHILTLLVAGQSPPIYSPVDDITIACGNSGQLSTNFDPRTWIGDISSKYSPIEVGKSNTTSAPPSSSASQPPYTTARLSYSEFTYKIPLSPGQKFIRLHFNPATYNPYFERANSLFSVQAGNFTLLHDFNASVTADFYGGPPLIREFCVNVETEQSLNITFTPAKDAYAFINGIEIISMPTSLYYISSAKFIGNETLYAIGNDTAMEMVYRINVGGRPISPNHDTGMYRYWDAADDTYLDDASRNFSVLPLNDTIKLNFVTIPEYSAPKAVYVTGRSMGTNKTINKSYNLTWVFPLDPKFYYLVRLHFCEFEPDIINHGDRTFQIYMANQTAEALADVIGWSKGNGKPVYKDYVVGMFMSPVGDRKKVDLFLVLAALQNDSYTSYNDAILNGLEIFKLSDINRNLAGPNPDSPIYIAYDGINLNCGFSGSVTYDNRMWIGDINSTLSIEEQLAGSQVRNAPPSSSNLSRLQVQVPYTTARISRFAFTYRFPLTAGQKFIRLHFNPASYGEFQSSEALFFVTAGRYTLLNNFNPSLVANVEAMETIYKEFCLNIETNNALDLTFSPSRGSNNAYAFINGIEIVSMPTNLYYSAAEGPGVKDVGKKVTYHIENNTALEMVYRINIGGSTLLPDRDTGMYRNWYGTDDVYMDVLSRRLSVIQSNTSNQLKFFMIPNYTAPGDIYQTGRSTGTKETIHKSYNLTWAFPVDPKFSYLVRLHFCEFDPDITLGGDRVFRVYIANQTAEERADIIMWTGGNGIPIYKDYVVFMSDPEGQEKVFLFVSLQAYPKYGQTSYTDGILNGLEIFKQFDSKNSQISKISNKSTMIAIVGGVLSGILVCFVLGFLVIKRPWKSKDSGSRDRTTKSTMTPGSPLPSYFCRYFSLAEIKAATKNFNGTFIIGVGGFGNVYKGCIDGEATPVAIKRLKRESSQGAHEFKTEIEILSQLRHRHLVSLIGYCADKGEMILVYDYMARGTLRDHLYHTNNPPLPWQQRLQICIGTARGLQYLHSGAKGTIIHRDVKSTNILLDDKWVAKVSDFGLSKGTNNISKTHISTVVKGSFGYLDPEYYRRQRLTEKSDVYSLGVVLFEVLCARPAVIQTEELKQVSLAEWAKSCHQNGELDQIIDPSLRGKIAAECLNKFTEVAIGCMDDNGMDRPSMNDVVRGLELALHLQKSAEGNSNCTEKNVETETSSGEHSCATVDSIKCISATIFSEINNPSGR